MKNKKVSKDKDTTAAEEPKATASEKTETRASRRRTKDAENQIEKTKEDVKHVKKEEEQKKDKQHQESGEKKKEDVKGKEEKKGSSKEKQEDGDKRGKSKDSKEKKKDKEKFTEPKEKGKSDEKEKKNEKKQVDNEKKQAEKEKGKKTKERSSDKEKTKDAMEEEKAEGKDKAAEKSKKGKKESSKDKLKESAGSDNKKEEAKEKTKDEAEEKPEEAKKGKGKNKKEELKEKAEEALKENLEGSAKQPKQRAIKRKANEAEKKKKDAMEIETAKSEDEKDIKKAKKTKSKDKKEKKGKKDKPEVKGKRGFKVCRNPECNQFVHIHKKICPHCSFAFDFLDKKSEETGETLSKYLVKKKKGPKKKNEPQEENVGILELDSTSKKKLFIRDDFVVNLGGYKNTFQPELRKEFLSNYQLPQLQILSKNVGAPKHKEIEICFEDRSAKQHVSTFNSKRITDVDRTNQDFLFEKILNYGTPIETVSWAYTDPKNETLKNEFYFVVAAQAPQTQSDLKNIDVNQVMTSMALSLESFSRFGHKTESHGLLSFYKLSIEDGRDIKDPELLYQIKHPGGSALKMEWIPQIYCGDDVIGFVYVLTAGGTILAFLPPKKTIKDSDAYYSLQPSIKIALETGFITSFAVLPKKPWNRLLIGDVLGNIFLIEVQHSKEEKTSSDFTIIRSYPFAHTKAVKELRWCPKLDEDEEELLFSSSSDDGSLKIWNYNQYFSPIYTFSSLKRAINSHIWDLGGKFVIENMDFAPFSTKALVFENLRQEAKQNAETNEQLTGVEQRHISHPEGCLKCSNSYFSKYFGLTDAAGNIFLYKIESFRKALTYASKKSKTNSSVLVLTSSIEENSGGKLVFKIKYTDSVKQLEKETKKKVDDYRLMTNAFELLPNPILQQSEKENQGRQLKTIALCGNYLGIVRIIGIYT